jgi:predicted transcriptional regulator
LKSEWITALAQSLDESADKVPDGWKTSRQVADEMGRSIGNAQKVIKSLVSSGLAETKVFRVNVPGCGVRPVPHYRINKKKAA